MELDFHLDKLRANPSYFWAPTLPTMIPQMEEKKDEKKKPEEKKQKEKKKEEMKTKKTKMTPQTSEDMQAVLDSGNVDETQSLTYAS